MRNYHDSYTAVRNSVLGYLIRSGDAVSQLVNVVVFLGQNPNESISGRTFFNFVRIHRKASLNK